MCAWWWLFNAAHDLDTSYSIVVVHEEVGDSEPELTQRQLNKRSSYSALVRQYKQQSEYKTLAEAKHTDSQ